MALDVLVQVSSATLAGQIGFGIPLILVTGAEKAIDYAEYTSLSELSKNYEDTTDAYKTAKLMWGQTNAPTSIAVYTSTKTGTEAITEVIDKGWRQLVIIKGESDTTANKDIASYIETTSDKMFFVTVTTTEELTALKGDSGYDRTVAFFYNLKNDEGDIVEPYAVAAIIGESAGRTVGSYTYKNLIIKGLNALDLSENEVKTIHDAGGITLLLKAGDVVTSEGKVTSGEYIDIMDSLDWIIQQIQYNSQKLLNSQGKLPYSDTGISALENVTVNVLQEAYNNGIIASDEDGETPLYTVNFKTRAEMSDTDRANRKYTGGNFEFTLAGAIHYAEIKGQLVI